MKLKKKVIISSIIIILVLISISVYQKEKGICSPFTTGQFFHHHFIFTYNIYDINNSLITKQHECRWTTGNNLTEIEIYIDEKGIIDTSSLPEMNRIDTGKIYGLEEHTKEIVNCAKLRYLELEEENKINYSEEQCLHDLAITYNNPAFCELILMNINIESLCFASFNETRIDEYFDEKTQRFNWNALNLDSSLKELVCYSSYYRSNYFLPHHPSMPSHHFGVDFEYHYEKFIYPGWCKSIYDGFGDTSSDYIRVSGYVRSNPYKPACLTCASKTYVRSYWRRK